ASHWPMAPSSPWRSPAYNVCEGDACGFENSKITWLNVLWLIICWMPITALFGFSSTYAPLVMQ
ncbi:hypothetical protein NP534_24925, partial [Pseudomonas sp. 39004]|nr:hypothetical protein [Pseudomonas sp. 39004]